MSASGPDFSAYVAATVAAAAAAEAAKDEARGLEVAARKLRTPPRGLPATLLPKELPGDKEDAGGKK